MGIADSLMNSLHSLAGLPRLRAGVRPAAGIRVRAADQRRHPPARGRGTDAQGRDGPDTADRGCVAWGTCGRHPDLPLGASVRRAPAAPSIACAPDATAAPGVHAGRDAALWARLYLPCAVHAGGTIRPVLCGRFAEDALSAPVHFRRRGGSGGVAFAGVWGALCRRALGRDHGRRRTIPVLPGARHPAAGAGRVADQSSSFSR